jgi:hypothetical protein
LCSIPNLVIDSAHNFVITLKFINISDIMLYESISKEDIYRKFIGNAFFPKNLNINIVNDAFMKEISKYLFVWFLFGLVLASIASASTRDNVAINDKIPLDNGASLILKDISGTQKTLWQVVDANNNILQEFGGIPPLGSFSYDKYFFVIGNVFIPGMLKSMPDAEVSPLNIKKVVNLQPRMVLTTDDSIACGTQLLDFSSYTHHIADYIVSLSKYTENKYNVGYKNTFTRETLGGSILIYKNGSLGLMPGGNQINHLNLDEINAGYDLFCGGGYDYMGEVSGIVYNIKIVDVTQSSMTLEFFGCDNDGRCDTEFKENRTSCPKDCKTLCGDNICESSENGNCCQDCGCANNLTCVSNVCVKEEATKENLTDNNINRTEEINAGQQKISFIQRVIMWFKNIFS